MQPSHTSRKTWTSVHCCSLCPREQPQNTMIQDVRQPKGGEQCFMLSGLLLTVSAWMFEKPQTIFRVLGWTAWKCLRSHIPGPGDWRRVSRLTVFGLFLPVSAWMFEEPQRVRRLTVFS